MSADRAQDADARLAQLREEIGRIDAEIVEAIARRMRLAREVGAVKASAGLPVLDPARESAVVAHAAALARDAGLPEEDVRALFWQLMAISRREQAAVTRDRGGLAP